MTNDILCDKCAHNNVCSHRDVYIKFQENLAELSISVPGHDDNSTGIWKLKDVPWILPTKLACADFMVGKNII